MPRVTLFVDSLGSGGAQRQVVELARALRGGPWRPRIAWYSPEPPFTPLPQGVQGVRIPRSGRRDPRFAANLRAALGPARTDLVHAFLGPPSLYAALSRQWPGGVPVISSVRMSARAFADFPAHAASHLAAALLGDHVVANARNVLPWMRARGVPISRLDYTPNVLATAVADRGPADPAALAACLQGYGLDPADPPLTLVGRFDAFKNQDGLLRALARLKAEGIALPPVLLVGRRGDARRAAEVRRIAAEAGIERLHLAPPTKDILTVLQASRLLALVSHSEGTPNIVMEALGLGVPVMATPVGQVPELVRDGVTGLLSADTSDAAIAARLRDALQLPADAIAAMRAAAAEDVRARFGAAAIAADLCALYERVVARPRPSRPGAIPAPIAAITRI